MRCRTPTAAPRNCSSQICNGSGSGGRKVTAGFACAFQPKPLRPFNAKDCKPLPRKPGSISTRSRTAVWQRDGDDPSGLFTQQRRTLLGFSPLGGARTHNSSSWLTASRSTKLGKSQARQGLPNSEIYDRSGHSSKMAKPPNGKNFRICVYTVAPEGSAEAQQQKSCIAPIPLDKPLEPAQSPLQRGGSTCPVTCS